MRPIQSVIINNLKKWMNKYPYALMKITVGGTEIIF